MKVSVFWAGYVWTPTWVWLAELWHNVTFVDPDEKKINSFKQWISPIKDDWINELLAKNINSISSTTSLEEWVKNSEVLIVSVWTPTKENWKLDISIIESIAEKVANIIENDMWKKYFVVKSTVPISTWKLVNDKIQSIINERISNNELDYRDKNQYIEYISNPEFLEEWKWLEHTLNPNRIVLWLETKDAIDKMEELYWMLNSPIIYTNIISAEYIKLCANVQLAVQVAITNEQSNIARLLWIDYSVVKKALLLDKRIGRFLNPWPWYGWFCFPKDTLEALKFWFENTLLCKVIFSAVETNIPQKIMPVTILKEYINNLDWLNIAIWWLAFKWNSDNIKESSSIDVIKELTNEWVSDIRASDPFAIENTKRVMKRNNPVSYHYDKIEALKWSEVLIIMTEHDEYKNLDLEEISENLEWKKIIIDSRWVLNKKYTSEDFDKYWIIYDWIWVKANASHKILSNNIS